MEREPENVIDGTARAHQWRRSRSQMVDAGPDGSQVRSDAPKSIAGSLLVPVEMLTEAPAPPPQTPPRVGVAAESHGGGGRGGHGDASAAQTRHENPFLLPAAEVPASSGESRRIRVLGPIRAAFVAIGAARRWRLAPHWTAAFARRIRRLRSADISLHVRHRRFARSAFAGPDQRSRRAHANRGLAIIAVAAVCAMLAGIATDPGQRHAARGTSSGHRQFAAASAGNTPSLNARAVMAARVGAERRAKMGTGKTGSKANARTRKVGGAYFGARRNHKRRPDSARAGAVTPVTTAAPASSTQPTEVQPTSSGVEASTAAAPSDGSSNAGGSGAAGGSSSLPPGPTGIGSTEGSNCNPKCS